MQSSNIILLISDRAGLELVFEPYLVFSPLYYLSTMQQLVTNHLRDTKVSSSLFYDLLYKYEHLCKCAHTTYRKYYNSPKLETSEISLAERKDNKQWNIYAIEYPSNHIKS